MGRCEHDQVAGVATPPHHPFGLGGLKLAMSADQGSLVVEVKQRVVEGPRLSLTHAHDDIGPCLTARGAQRVDGRAGHFHGVEEVLAEQRRSGRRRMRPHPVWIAGDEGLRKSDHAGALAGRFDNEIARLGGRRLLVEEDRGRMHSGHSRTRRSISHLFHSFLRLCGLQPMLVGAVCSCNRRRAEDPASFPTSRAGSIPLAHGPMAS